MRTLAISALALGLVASAASARASEWEIDPAHSTAQFSVKHMMVTTVRGQFDKVTGRVALDDKDPTKSSIDVKIDPATINTREPKRDEHLKSADFFDVKKFPEITFKSTKIAKAGKNKFNVTGDLTMHGVTKPVVLAVEGPTAEAKSPFGQTVRGVSATGKVNRKDFGLNWNKALETGGVLVGDEVTLQIDAELVRKDAASEEAPKAPAEPKSGKLNTDKK
jgi:polyisoprenoid-binding protein YceI